MDKVDNKYIKPLRNAFGISEEPNETEQKQARLVESIMSRSECIPYIEFSIQLHGCVKDPKSLMLELQQWLKTKLDPDNESDDEIDLIRSAGWKDANE